MGTPAHERTRDHLVGELRRLGLEPEVQMATAESSLRSGTDGSVLVGRVANVVAVLPGHRPTGRVFLVAHYDSVMNSPGASDNGAAVVAILETVRALQAGPALRNDVVVVFTDGEEPGLLGAEAFVREHPLAQDGGVVLNLEASGSHGPSTLFETTNGCLIDTYAATPHPFGDSSTAAFYALSSHNTDFTVFTRAGFQGLNSAYSRGSTDYHTPQDSIANLSRASLQHHGANLLSLTRAFGTTELAAESTHGCADTVFFSALGRVVRYPEGLALPLAVVALIGLAAAVAVGHRRQHLTLPRTLAGFGLTLVPLLLAPLAPYALWQGLVSVRPGYADLEMGDPHRPDFYRLAIVALTAAVLVGWYALPWRRIGPVALALGALGWLALVGVVTGWAAPGASFLFVIPALGASFGALVALLLPDSRRRWHPVPLAVGAAPTAFFLTQLVWELSASVGMASAAIVAFLLALLGLAFVPLFALTRPAPPRAVDQPGRPRPLRSAIGRRAGAGAALLVLAGILTGTGLVIDRFDPGHPRPAHLHYLLDGDTGSATWVSRDRQPSEWTCGYVDCTKAPDPAAELNVSFPWVGNRPMRTGPARPSTLARPELTVLDDHPEGDTRMVTMRVWSPRGAPVISLHVDHAVTRATVDDHPLADVTAPKDGSWPFGLEIQAPSSEGHIVTLWISGHDAVRLRIADHSYGLVGISGFTPPTCRARHPHGPLGCGLGRSHPNPALRHELNRERGDRPPTPADRRRERRAGVGAHHRDAADDGK